MLQLHQDKLVAQTPKLNEQCQKVLKSTPSGPYLINFALKITLFIKTNYRFEISAQHRVDLCTTQNDSSTLIFLEKFCRTPPQGWVKK